MNVREGGRRNVRQGSKRQAVADGAIARHQEDLAAPRLPPLADPALVAGALRIPRLHGQNIAGRLRQAALEDACEAAALFRVLELGVGGIDIVGKVGFLDQPFRRVFIGGQYQIGLDAEMAGNRGEQTFGIRGADAGILTFLSDEIGIAPDGLAVLAPIEREGPAWQGFARIPLALTIMQEAVGGKALAQFADEDIRLLPLGRADGASVPFLGFEIVDGDEGRLAAHGEAHILCDERAIDGFAKRIQLFPAFIRKGLGDARMFGNARHPHVEGEFGIGLAEIAAGDRRCVAIMRGGRQGNMAFAGQKPRCRVKTDPAGTRQIDFRPGMQIGEIHFRTGRSIERLQIRRELNEIAGDEAGGQPETAQHLHQKPAGIAAGALARQKRFFRGLHAGLHADDVTDGLLKLGIDADDHIDGRLAGRLVDGGHQRIEERAGLFRLAVDRQIVLQRFRIVEGPFGGAFFDEEIEGIIDRHIRNEIDLDLELGDRIGKDEAGLEVAVRILLQIDEMIGGRDLQRMADDLGA